MKNTITKTKDNELQNILYAYQYLENRTQILDDEFQILYYLFLNIDKITNGLTKKNINNMKIKIFTFMDMCPACFTAWHILYDKLKKVYCDKLCINSNLNLNVDVYSIKPYCDIKHSFFKNKKIYNSITENESPLLKKWCNILKYYTRRRFKMNYNCEYNIKQHMDCISVVNLLDLSEELNTEKLNASANNYIDNSIVDFFTRKENMKMKNLQEYYNSIMNLQFNEKTNNTININEDLEEEKKDDNKKDKDKYKDVKQYNNKKKKFE